MTRFIDTAGVVRGLSINLAHRRTIKQETGWDLVELAHKPDRLQALLEALQSDDELLWRILAILTSSTIDELLQAADGTVHEEAASAFLEALTNFFPAASPLRRPLESLWRALRDQRTAAATTIETTLLAAVQSIGTSSEIFGSTTSTSGSGEYQHSPQATG